MDFILPIERHSKIHRYKYLVLYYALREAIHDGILTVGTRLPSTRELAALYGLSRGSVSQAYDMLHGDGYVYAEMGSGTYVSDVIPRSTQQLHEGSTIELSAWGGIVTELPRLEQRWCSSDNLISFCDTGPSLELFPLAEWKSAIAAAVREELDSSSLALEDAAGDIELREAIAAHLRHSRGIAADAEQICLFNGSMQALVLLAQLLLGPGQPAVLENPCYTGISRAVAACGARTIAAEVDGDGIVPRDWDARLLFVTPGRQYPTGAVLSPARRRELLAWAARRNAVIIEDDYDSEFRFAGRPLEPLKALDREERVVYVGSFSKTMFAALRIGYAVLPPSLVEPMARAKALYEPVSPARLEQRALARFMRRGEYARHLRRMRRYYGERHEWLCTSMHEYAGALFDLQPSDAGLHVYARWCGTAEDYELFRSAVFTDGVHFRDASIYHLSAGAPAACFCFARLDHKRIREGIQRMADVWKVVLSGRR
ncbi:PLP-dependent aminotransferase family protein [Paenibacillus lentus]|uniref:PLP-dependent aminotransferase family protein n=1 Tax=Paenibacillus lentus TaxID=1338368 RepID=A0A3Q8SE03_9BACL|nr:PLP-dependent aminotransferase family protein [Paenibacillus lentus]AZK48380.1 PLP-dependent aminotransferase family protein [Paenibacillus lentus]